MFSSFSLSLTSWLRPRDDSWKMRDIPLPPVQVHDIENAAGKQAKTLKHLLKANHTNYRILYHHDIFHNHAPHILGSTYMLGGSHDQLSKVYDRESTENEPWYDAPGELSKDDWRDYLGKKQYQRAYIDFFEDQLVAFGYDWKALLTHYMFEGKNPLVNSVVSGLGHPLIHLGYAFELDSPIVAIEAMGLTACCYDVLHKYLDDPAYTKPASFSSKSTLDILRRVAKDERLKTTDVGGMSIDMVPRKHEDILVDYWNAWDVGTDPLAQFNESQKTAAAVVVGTHEANNQYDFFLLHVLTTSHAVRILLPLVPAHLQLPLVRQWWLLVLTSYIGQDRPEIDMQRIEKYELGGRGWKNATKLALESQHALDAHYVKGIRALKVAAETWGDSEQFYLKAAIKLATEFDGWGGFGSMGTNPGPPPAGARGPPGPPGPPGLGGT